MKTTITLNRYYAEDFVPGCFERMKEAIELFNRFKVDTYNAYYDKAFFPEKYKKRLNGQTISRWMKNTFCSEGGKILQDYYINAIDSAARGCVSSQKELKKLNIDQLDSDLASMREKIKEVEDALIKVRSIKESIVTYVKTGKFPSPYSRCRISIQDDVVYPYNQPSMPLDVYERKIEERIRNLKQRKAGISFAYQRKIEKQKLMAENPPKRAVFGSRKFYKQKDTIGCTKQWKEEFHYRRNKNMTLPGRHTAATGNFLVLFDEKEMSLTFVPPYCTRGEKDKLIVFKDIKLYRYAKEFLSVVKEKSICYSFELRKDGNGREYILPSITFELPEKTHINYGFSDGCIGADINYGFIAWADISAEGEYLDSGIIPCRMDGTTGQNKQAMGDACAKLAAICKKRKKPLCIENIDLKNAKAGVHYQNKKRNRAVSVFAYQCFREIMKSRAYREDFAVYDTDPAYTSFFGKLRMMGKKGISVHESAAFMIGLKEMDPEKFWKLPAWAMYSFYLDDTVTDMLQAIKKLYGSLSKIRTHTFYHHSFLEQYVAEPRPFKKIVSSLKKEEKKLIENQLISSHKRNICTA